MQKRQIVTYGLAGVLAENLRELAQSRRFWLRETSQLSACQNLVSTSVPKILVLVLSGNLERELALVEQVHASLPATAIIVIGEADNPALTGLAWDLGATYVLSPPAPVEMIEDVIARCLEEPAS
jgi:DNA-binding NarL/FixJ family response regulator